MRIKDKLRDKLNQFSLKTQLTSLIIFTVSGIIIIIIMFNYERNIHTIMVQQISVSSSLLNLETQNLDSYMSEINRYSLFLRNNAEILQSLTKDRALNYSEVTNIQNQIKSNFYSRNDLLSYQLYLLNQSEDYEITSERQKIKVSYGDTIKSLPEYKAFTIGKYYKYVQATKETNSFFIFYRTIINIEDRKPIAVVKLTLDTSFADSLAENHNDTGELFCVMNKEGQLFYSNHDEMTSVQDSIRIKDELIKGRDNNFITQINGQKYLAIYNTSKLHDYYIVILKPLELIDYQVNNTRNMSLVLGLLSISLAASLAFFFVELVTKPLSKLSHRLKKVGKGNFTTTAKIGGSREIVQLADSFNQMIYQIDELIKKNYLSELNEKTARLIALEAQINPHFLYNTLQAISAEAIVNDQLQINSMVTSLASMLRYSIKGGDLVRLKDEMKHVLDYLLLQPS
jgi:two-component system sensor histidine kinase YesM